MKNLLKFEIDGDCLCVCVFVGKNHFFFCFVFESSLLFTAFETLKNLSSCKYIIGL